MAHSSVRFSQRFGRIVILAGFIAGNVVTPALAGPSGGRIIAGQGAISQSGANSTINQGSDRLIIEWQNFDTSAGESVRFNQPSSSASVLNRIISGNATVFDGSLFANGNVVIVNGSGIHFGPNSRIDVGSLIASTADISNSNFLNNRLIFDRPGQPDASITNAGTITVRDTGLAALVAPGVENSGLIQANLGTVILAAGEAHTIDFNGDGLMSFTVTKPTTAKPKERNGKTLDALVSNKGEIRADGGTVLLTARQASRVLDNSINMSGVVRANSVGVRNGKIVLFGGKRGRVNVSGKIRARGKRRGQRGGRVHITGRKVAVPIAKIDVTGKAGGGEVLIGGAYKGGKLAGDSSIGYLQSGDLVSILTGTNAGAAGNGYFPNAQETLIGKQARIDAGSENGNGGSVIVWGQDRVDFLGTIDTRGGDNGFVEVSTKGTGTITGTAHTGDLLIDPGDVCVTTGGATSGCAAGATNIADTTILTVLDTGGLFTLNTDVSGTSGTGRVDFGGGGNLTVNNNSGTIGTFRIQAADTINTQQVGFLSNGTTGTNYEFFAGSASTATPTTTADVILFGQNFSTGGGNVIFDAADDVIINDPLQTSGGDISIIARGGDTDALLQFNTDDARLDTTDGAGNAGLISIQTDRLEILSSATFAPQINANGTGGTVVLDSSTAGTAINLGTITAGSLSFTDAQLDRIAAETLQIGSTTSGDITISSQITPVNVGTLALVTGGTVTDGTATEQADLTATNVTISAVTGIGTAANDIDVDATTLTTTNSTSGAVNVANTGSVTASGASTASTFAASGSSFNVATGATIVASDTIDITAPTVNLDGNLSATNGITGTATIVNVLGSDGDAEIQDGVDLALADATVNVASGSYSSFIINKENLTVAGVGSATIVNATSPAITIVANGATVQDMLLQGTRAVDDVGILLDGATTPGLTGISIMGVNFSNLDDGIRSQGDIGDGVAANVDVAISGTSTIDPAIFEDFLDAAIDVGDTNGDAVYTVTDIVVRDGAIDVDALSSDGDGIRFGAVGNVTVNRVDISGTTQEGVDFDAIAGATVTVSNSSIDAGRHGILFDGVITDATTAINITGNALIQGASQGVVFTENVTDATIIISGNGTDASNGIRGTFDSIAVNGSTLTNVTFLIGGDDAADGNYIVSNSQALDIDAIVGGSFIVANNHLLQGGNALEFEQAISGGAAITIVDNTAISGNLRGVDFLGNITDSTVTIAGNGISGSASNSGGHGVNFNAGTSITDSTITIGSAAVTVDGTALTPGGNMISGAGTGVNVAAIVNGDTTFNITDNQIGNSATRTGVDGILFENGILGTATVTIGGTNQVFAAGRAINVNDLQSSTTLSITGGTYDGTGGSLLVDNTGVVGTDGRLNVGAAAYVGGTGSTVFEVLTETGNAGVDIDFSGAATFDGGANGVRLSGTGIDVLNDTFGTISFGATTAQTGNVIELANGAEFLPDSPTILDATGVSFGGLLPAAMTTTQLLALEGTLVHFLDDPTLGLINTGALVVPDGNSIQLAVNAAGLLGGTQTVTVGPGTFGGSVEVWVDNLTLTGQGATTIIDTDAVDANANDGDANNGFQIASITAMAGGAGDVTGVTIQGFSFDTLTTTGTNTGIELGETGTSTAIDSTLSNNIINDQSNGIFSNLTSGTTAITDNTLMALGNRGINFADDIIAGETVTITGNNVASARFALVFDASVTSANVTISGNTIASTVSNDAIIFDGTVSNSTVLIGGATAAEGNDIAGFQDGIDIATISGGTFTVSNNTRIVGGTGDGLEFEGTITANSAINIVDNTLIQGADNGVSFLQAITSSTATITSNAAVQGTAGDGISFGGAVNGDTNINIADNQIGTATTRTGVEGITFEGGILGTATVTIGGTNQIFATNRAINVDDLQSSSTLSITGGTYDGTGGALLVDNTGIAGTDGRLNVGTAAYIGGTGSTVFEVLTDMGNAGVDIDFTGAATFDGGANGVRLSGTGIDVLNDTFGTISFGATTAQTGNVIELANGAEFLPDSPTILDATNTLFGGTAGSALTVAQLFALETQLVHFPDDATLGLINTNDLFVVQGESIQTAVNAAGLLAGAQTVTVTAGTFGGSVEVWVDELTLTGQGATTIIDTDSVDPFANNGDVDNGFQVAAISMIAGGPADVTGVTIEGFAFDTVTTTGTNIGIELGETAVSDAINATVQNNTFTDLNVGVQSNQSSGTTQVSGNTMTAIATRGITFEDTLNTGDAVTVSGNAITSANDALRFAAAIADASVIVSGNTLTSTAADGTHFAGSITTASTVTVSGNDIEGADDGVDFSGAIATASTINVQNNDRVEGLNTVGGDDGLGDGIAFGGAISGAMTSINIDSNTLIRGNDRGINFRDATTGGPATITDASITISGNNDISGVTLDGILFNANITNANITIGGANAADGNSITGNDEGLDIEQIIGGTFTIANNTLITGITGDGVEFEDPISGGATIEVSGNTAINGLLAGITFEGALTDSVALISGNTSIAGGLDGIQTSRLTNSTFSVLQNETIMGTADAGILFVGPVNNGSTVEVAGNGEVRGGNDGVSFAFNIRDSNVAIAGNTQITGDFFDGVNFFGNILDSTVTIGAATVSVNGVPTTFGGNTITATEDGIFHASGTVIAGSSVVTYSNNDITAGFDAVHFDGIIESAAVNVIDNTNLTGQAFEGVFFQEEVENNATVTIARNSITGGDDGIEFDEQVRDDAVVTIADNTISGTGDGVEFEEEIEDNAVVTISGNIITAANEQGVEINGLLDQSSLTVDRNTIIGSENGIAFEAEITDTATTTISANTITGGNGIAFNDFVDTTNANGVQVTDNNGITGNNGDGVVFNGPVTNAPITIARNTVTGNNGVSFNGAVAGLDGSGLQIVGNSSIIGNNGDGIVFNAPVTDTAVTIGTSTIAGSDDGINLAGMFAGTASATITGNTITGTGSEGVDTGDIGDSVAITIGNNTITGTTGVRFGAVTTGAANGVQIVNNTRITGTTQHGIHLNGPVTNTPITINGNTEIAGIDTGIKASGTVTNATVNLEGNATVTGGVTGVHFESLSGATINTANTDIAGGTNGFKAFGSTAAGATSRLNFTNSAIRGTLGAGLRVTTTAGGSGIDTNLGGGLTLTGLPSLALSGPNQTLVGDTLGDTRFNSVNGGNYIELSNGALFEPGRPTIINGNSAFFDGVQVPAFSLPALVQSIEDRLIDFDDNNTLGQIFFRPLVASDVVDIAQLINQFALVIEGGIRISNPQTPGDLILRPDYPFDILFGDLLANLYPLGGCLPIFDDTGEIASFSCIAPAHGSDISEFVDAYMADLPLDGS